MPRINDTEVFTLLRTILAQGIADAGVTGVEVEQAYQSDQNNAPRGRIVYIAKQAPEFRGWPGRRSVYNAQTQKMDNVDLFFNAPTYTISSFTTQSQKDADYLSASNIQELCIMIMQLGRTVTQLAAAGFGIQRVTKGSIRQAYWVDPEKNFEQSPSFDIVLTYRESYESISEAASVEELDIHRV